MDSASTASWQFGRNAPRLGTCRCLGHLFFDILQTGSGKADVELDMTCRDGPGVPPVTCRDGPGVPPHLTVGQYAVGLEFQGRG